VGVCPIATLVLLAISGVAANSEDANNSANDSSSSLLILSVIPFLPPLIYKDLGLIRIVNCIICIERDIAAVAGNTLHHPHMHRRYFFGLKRHYHGHYAHHGQ
jgi:hypothetical protein